MSAAVESLLFLILLQASEAVRLHIAKGVRGRVIIVHVRAKLRFHRSLILSRRAIMVVYRTTNSDGRGLVNSRFLLVEIQRLCDMRGHIPSRGVIVLVFVH